MRAGPLGFLALVTGVTLSASPAAHAYSLKHSPSGAVAHWGSGPIVFQLDPALRDAHAGEDARRAVERAIDAWGEAEHAPDIALERGNPGPRGYQPGTSGNGIYLAHDWPVRRDLLAVTVLTYEDRTGRIVDADILINPAYRFRMLESARQEPSGGGPQRTRARLDNDEPSVRAGEWMHEGKDESDGAGSADRSGRASSAGALDRESSARASDGGSSARQRSTRNMPSGTGLTPLSRHDGDPTFDLASVLAHEMGHVLGLEKSQDEAATMWPRIKPERVDGRNLAADDRAGIAAIYRNRSQGPSGGCGGASVVRASGGSPVWGAALLTVLVVFLSRRRYRV